MAVSHHRAHGAKTVRCFVITISDTRDESTDTSGKTIIELLQAKDQELKGYEIVRDEPTEIERLLREGLKREDVDVVFLNGGTGIAPRDGTYEVVCGLLDKKLEGFGELFRVLSYQEIGAAAMMSRAVAGTVGRKVIFSLPGATAAVRLAMEKLIIPELGHVVSQAQGQ